MRRLWELEIDTDMQIAIEDMFKPSQESSFVLCREIAIANDFWCILQRHKGKFSFPFRKFDFVHPITASRTSSKSLMLCTLLLFISEILLELQR